MTEGPLQAGIEPGKAVNPAGASSIAVTEASGFRSGAGPGPMADQSILLVDSRGVIRQASAGACRRLRHRPEALVGRALRELVRGLPLRGDTPGYNLAYLLFAFPGGGWHSVEALDGACSAVRIRLALVRLESGDGPRILICVDGPEVAAGTGPGELDRMIAKSAGKLGPAPKGGDCHERVRAVSAPERLAGPMTGAA